MKRHYDSKHKKDFDSAYLGKGERLKEFKKRFEAYPGLDIKLLYPVAHRASRF